MSSSALTIEPALFVQTQECADPDRAAQDLVLLHGWGMHSGAWLPLIQQLAKHYRITTVDLPGFGQSQAVPHNYEIESLLKELDSVLPESYLLIGWSLGGNIATCLAHRFPEKVLALVTIASNPQFVASEDWPHAMSQELFEQFSQGFDAAPQAGLKRFASLQAAGDGQEKSLRKQLQSFTSEVSELNCSTVANSLALLAKLDTKSLLSALNQPTLHVLGANDTLVPEQVAEQLVALNGYHSVHLLSGLSHAPMLSNAPGLAVVLDEFFSTGLLSQPNEAPAIEKKLVADSFSRAADTYDEVARLQRHVGEQLLSMLPSDQVCARVLDLGSGTAYFSRRLPEYFAKARVLGLDIAPGMLSYARSHSEQCPCDWLCADAEFLPLADNSIDFVFSNLTIQWCDQPARLMREIHRVLKPGGTFLFSTLGPDTLWELRLAWNHVDSHVHVNRFVAVPVLQQAIDLAGFQHSEIHAEYQVHHYRELGTLTHELKALGAHNVNAERPKGLTGRERVRRFKQAYESLRDREGNLPATWQVVIGMVNKGTASKDKVSKSHD